MSAENFKIIVITPEHRSKNEPETIASLFEAGLELLHLRKPDYTLKETEDLLVAIPENFHPRIVLHNHYEFLHKFNLKGIHLPENRRKDGNPASLSKIISTSFHSLADLLEEKTPFEYAFFSPVFRSISKQGYSPSLGINTIQDFLSTYKNKINFPVIALGGITDKNITVARDVGFNGVACIGYVWEGATPAEQYKKLRNAVRT